MSEDFSLVSVALFSRTDGDKVKISHILLRMFTGFVVYPVYVVAHVVLGQFFRYILFIVFHIEQKPNFHLVRG